MKNPFFKHLEHFRARTEISYEEMLDMVLTYNEPFVIYAEKLDGSNLVREMYSIPGPSGNVKYDYFAKGYMIFYDETVQGFRTVVLDNVSKVVKDGQSYLVV